MPNAFNGWNRIINYDDCTVRTLLATQDYFSNVCPMFQKTPLTHNLCLECRKKIGRIITMCPDRV